jgi:hypothetical protein
MIRVTKTEEQSRTIITIDGQLSGDGRFLNDSGVLSLGFVSPLNMLCWEILLKRRGFGVSGLILVDDANVHDLRSRNRNVIFQSFEDQTHPAPNVTGFEAVRTAP